MSHNLAAVDVFGCLLWLDMSLVGYFFGWLDVGCRVLRRNHKLNLHRSGDFPVVTSQFQS